MKRFRATLNFRKLKVLRKFTTKLNVHNPLFKSILQCNTLTQIIPLLLGQSRDNSDAITHGFVKISNFLQRAGRCQFPI